MGATPRRAEEDQIPRTQQIQRADRDGDGLAETLLLIRVPGDPDALAGKGQLHQA